MIQRRGPSWPYVCVPGAPTVLPVSKPRIKRTISGGWVCYRLYAAAAGSELIGNGNTPLEAFDSYQRLNKFGEYFRKAPDSRQVARSPVVTYQRTNQEENVTSEKLKRFSKWPLFWFVLMWVSGLVPVLCALLSR